MGVANNGDQKYFVKWADAETIDRVDLDRHSKKAFFGRTDHAGLGQFSG